MTQCGHSALLTNVVADHPAREDDPGPNIRSQKAGAGVEAEVGTGSGTPRRSGRVLINESWVREPSDRALTLDSVSIPVDSNKILDTGHTM